MLPIDEVRLNFNPTSLTILNIILGLIVFGVSLDIKVEDFRKIARTPKPFIVGAFSQFLLFPGIAFLMMYLFKPHPSIAYGIILVAACPGGNTSNFMTQLAKGNAALSISMSTFSTALATFMTPINIAFWGGLLPGTEAIRRSVSLDPVEMFYLILVLMLIPLSLGVFIAHKYPKVAAKLKRGMKIFSLGFFFVFIIFAIAANFKYLLDYIGTIILAVVLINILGFLVGYYFSKSFGLEERDRRAVAIEIGIQNTGLGLILIFNFFDGLGGMAMIAALWGVWHLIAGFGLAFYWSKK